MSKLHCLHCGGVCDESNGLFYEVACCRWCKTIFIVKGGDIVPVRSPTAELIRQVAGLITSSLYAKLGYHLWPTWFRRIIGRSRVAMAIDDSVEWAVSRVVNDQGFIIRQPGGDGPFPPPSDN